MSKKVFTFLIPCFNCDQFIFRNSLKLIKKINQTKIHYNLIFLNDGSTDDTLIELKKIKSKKNIKIISFKNNSGKSTILKFALKKCQEGIVILYDCDLPYFSYLTKLIGLLKKGEKFVTIDRRALDSKFDKSKLNFYQISRYLISKGVNIIISNLITKNFQGDTQSGLKGFYIDKKFKKEEFISTKFFLDAEIISYFTNRNVKVYSIPINYKISKQSSIKILNLSNFVYLYELIKIIIFGLIKFRN
tara:strand:- start:2318 stop:3055 length:738 start_codon:yes stop_codon:yes gene_type:complete